MCDIPIVQISTLAKYHNCGDAMDGMIMTNCPTKSEFDGLQSTTMDPDQKQRQRLYLANKQILAIVTLGMTSSHGLAGSKRL